MQRTEIWFSFLNAPKIHRQCFCFFFKNKRYQIKSVKIIIYSELENPARQKIASRETLKIIPIRIIENISNIKSVQKTSIFLYIMSKKYEQKRISKPHKTFYTKVITEFSIFPLNRTYLKIPPRKKKHNKNQQQKNTKTNKSFLIIYNR